MVMLREEVATLTAERQRQHGYGADDPVPPRGRATPTADDNTKEQADGALAETVPVPRRRLTFIAVPSRRNKQR